MERICASMRGKIMSAAEAAALIGENEVIGCSGLARVGNPKAVPMAMVENHRGSGMTLLSGASLGAQVDGIFGKAGLIGRRFPYQSDPDQRRDINAGKIAYADMHLSHMPEYINRGGLDIDWAIVECAAIQEDGLLLAAALGATDCFIRNAKHIILEVNETVPLGLYGMHDIYEIGADPIPLRDVKDRVGQPLMPYDPNRVEAVVLSRGADQFQVFTDPDEESQAIADNIIRFLKDEIASGRQPANLHPIQSGTGSVANAVMDGLGKSGFSGLRMYSEVLQDAAFELIERGIMETVSTTSVSLSETAAARFYADVERFKDKIIIRPQEMANNPEIIRRLGIITINTPIECDIYGNVNSTHIMGSRIMNGLGGSGDFTRNGGLSIFSTKSLAKGGNISSIVPMCSHVDHTEHDVQVIVTEQGLADLRWKSPRERAEIIIDRCAHPSYRPLLREYFEEACAKTGGQTPHMLDKALSWHIRYQQTGSMMP